MWHVVSKGMLCSPGKLQLCLISTLLVARALT